MAWSDSHSLLRDIKKDQLISSSRRILDTPPFQCKSKRYNYNEEGFLVQIGKASKIKISISMLKACYEEAVKNNQIYNRAVFQKFYAVQLKDHGCHVHVIGQIFLLAGVADLFDEHSYKIKV